jgi:hypothetical protein
VSVALNLRSADHLGIALSPELQREAGEAMR